MATKFLYMDEQYIDPSTFRPGTGIDRRPHTSLTGVLIPAGAHRAFRSRFYTLVGKALGATVDSIPEIPAIHASSLFPDKTDEVKFDFLRGLVQISMEFDFAIYRVGYYDSNELLSIAGNRKNILGICFDGILRCLHEELQKHEIWPVMETDRSSIQDRNFAGIIQQIDYFNEIIGRGTVSLDNDNIGDMLYSTKRSAYGTLVDCIAYLLDARFQKTTGHPLSLFKESVAEIATSLEPLIHFDDIIEMQFRASPPD